MSSLSDLTDREIYQHFIRQIARCYTAKDVDALISTLESERDALPPDSPASEE